MKNKNLLTRLITASIGIPAIFCSIFFFPQHHYLVFSIILTFVTFFGAWELKNNIINKKIDTGFTSYLGVLLPVIEIINLNYLRGVELTLFALAAFMAFSFLMEIFNGEKDNYQSTLIRIAATSLNIIYPGLFMVYGIRLCYFESGKLIFLFIAIVFGSDSLAYFTGMLFGKNNKGIVKCSPNKSIAGFIGGTIVVGIIGALIAFIFPSFLPFSPLEAFVLYLLTSVFGTAGDLFESMIKRSAGIKDAGIIIPGRGGMLDCIDSISIAVPVFVLLVELMLR